MSDTVEALMGFSKRADEPSSAGDIAVPGYPDNRIALTPCRIRNARQSDTSLDREGFAIVEHRSAFARERDRQVLVKGYNEEMVEFLKHHMGADLVLSSTPNSMLVRYGARLVGRRVHDGPADVIDDRIPASFAHVDYLPDMAPQVAAYERQNAGLEDLDYSRMMIVQTWRALSDPPQDVPLAICDRRTLGEGDISPCRGILSPQNSEGLDDPSFIIGKIHFDADQRWYYYPSMRPEEVLIFTGFDSAHADGWKVGHAAFDNRRIHPDALPRVSVEARYYAYYR